MEGFLLIHFLNQPAEGNNGVTEAIGRELIPYQNRLIHNKTI